MKKGLRIVTIILAIIVILGLITFGVDYTRAKEGKNPIFCIKHPGGVIMDGGTTEYFGLGYKFIDFHTLAGFDDVKIVTWAMQYEDFEEEMKYYAEKYEERLWNDNMAATMKAVIIKVYETGLMVMQIDEDRSEVISLGIKEDIGFKKGQELLIHYNGMILESYPAQLGNVGKIEITKENSDVVIPDNILRTFYSFHEKVNITISELTNIGISLTITDTNEIPYDFAHSYIINKKVKNKDYTGKGQKIGEDTENSVAGFTRNRF